MLKDVGGVGQRDTIKDVSDGYALNYLIPNGLAVQATPDRIKQHEAKVRDTQTSAVEREKAAAAQAAQLEGKRVEILVKANEAGHLYQHLSADTIVDTIKKSLGITIPPEAVMINAPIKSIGESAIKVKLGTKTATVNVNVVPLA